MNIVVTGASSGIGYETTKVLAAIPGNRLVIIARNINKIQSLAGECNIMRQETAVHPIAFDLAGGNFADLADRISQHLGNIDILINNAGSILKSAFNKVTPGEFDNVFDVNVKAPYFLIMSLLPYLGNGSHIINITSMGGVQGSVKFPGLSVYSASKGALAVLTECLAVELEPLKIFVNCLAIGAVQTEMLSKAFPDYQAPVSAAKMAEFVSNFALNGHNYFNGKILPVSLSTP